jgi:DNA-binding NarL/FixJ family response regulator
MRVSVCFPKSSIGIWRAMEAGAAGYVSKSADIKEVIHAIRNIVAGKMVRALS